MTWLAETLGVPSHSGPLQGRTLRALVGSPADTREPREGNGALSLPADTGQKKMAIRPTTIWPEIGGRPHHHGPGRRDNGPDA